MDLIDALARLSTAVTGRVLRNIAESIDPLPTPEHTPQVIDVRIEGLDQLLTALQKPKRFGRS